MKWYVFRIYIYIWNDAKIFIWNELKCFEMTKINWELGQKITGDHIGLVKGPD